MKKGFTLSEVLIALGVVGVISALTLPGVIASYNNKVMIAKLQKTYNSVQNAIANQMTKEKIEDWQDSIIFETNSSDGTKKFLQENFAVSNLCDDSLGYSSCLADTYTNLSKDRSMSRSDILNSSLPNANTRACVTINSGATICISGNNFLIDTNGVQTPNISGKDLFWFGIYNDGKARLSASDSNGTSYDSAAYQAEARGDKCLDTSNAPVSPVETGCLLYIISHGWTFKY